MVTGSRPHAANSIAWREIEPQKGGRPKQGGATLPVDGREQAARDAGWSQDQRKQAQRIASIPREKFERVVESDDPAAFIVSENIARRHMTKGQRAIAVAMIYPDGAKGGRGKRSQNRESLTRREENAISQSRTILRYAPGLADSVLGGGTALSDAHRPPGAFLPQWGPPLESIGRFNRIRVFDRGEEGNPGAPGATQKVRSLAPV